MTNTRPTRLLISLAVASSLFALPALVLADDTMQGPPGPSMQRHMPMSADHEAITAKWQISPVEWQRIKALESAFLAAHDGDHPPTPQEFHAHEKDLHTALSPEHQHLLGGHRWKEGGHMREHGGMEAEMHRLRLTPDQWKKFHEMFMSVLTPAQQSQLRQDMAKMKAMHNAEGNPPADMPRQ